VSPGNFVYRKDGGPDLTKEWRLSGLWDTGPEWKNLNWETVVLSWFSQSVSSVAQSCLTLCDPMGCSMPGLPVRHQLLEFTQIHVHWVDYAIQPSSSVVPFSSCLQSFPASGSFPMSQLFASGGQSIGVSALASVLPKNTQDWSPLGWTGWISLQSKGLSRVFSSTTVRKHQFFGTQLSLSWLVCLEYVQVLYSFTWIKSYQLSRLLLHLSEIVCSTFINVGFSSVQQWLWHSRIWKKKKKLACVVIVLLEFEKYGLYFTNCSCARLLSHVWLFATLWSAACQAPPSMEFSRQEYWSRLPFPSPTSCS